MSRPTIHTHGLFPTANPDQCRLMRATASAVVMPNWFTISSTI